MRIQESSTKEWLLNAVFTLAKEDSSTGEKSGEMLICQQALRMTLAFLRLWIYHYFIWIEFLTEPKNYNKLQPSDSKNTV